MSEAIIQTLQARLEVAGNALNLIASRQGPDRVVAQEALTRIARIQPREPDPVPCTHCAAGHPRIKFNSLYLHTLPDGNEMHCTAPKAMEVA